MCGDTPVDTYEDMAVWQCFGTYIQASSHGKPFGAKGVPPVRSFSHRDLTVRCVIIPWFFGCWSLAARGLEKYTKPNRTSSLNSHAPS